MAFRLFTGTSTPGESVAKGSLNENDIIRKLINTLERSTLLQDKRHSIQNLKGYSRRYKKIVASYGYAPYFSVICDGENVRDEELILTLLELLLNLIDVDAINREADGRDEWEEICGSFCKYLYEEPSNKRLECLVDLLDEENKSITHAVLKLLHAISQWNGPLFCSKMLLIQTSISSIIKLLRSFEGSEIISAEAFHLLTLMVSQSVEVQKLAAFQGAIEITLKVIQDEKGLANGSYEVDSALGLLHVIIDGNVKNQIYMLETGFLSKLIAIFQGDIAFVLDNWQLANWTQFATRLFAKMFGVIRLMLVADEVEESRELMEDLVKFQNIFIKAKFIEIFTGFSFQSIVPPELRSHALLLIGDLLKGNLHNASIWSKAVLKVSVGRKESIVQPALLRVAQTALDSTVEYVNLRFSSVYLLECYFFNNHEGQIAVISTLIPPPDDSTPGALSIGSLLMRSLFDFAGFSKDPLKCFLSSAILTRLLRGNVHGKEKAMNFVIDLNIEHGEENETPTFVVNLFLALKYISGDYKSVMVKNAFYSLLIEFIVNNPLCIDQLLPFGLIEYLCQNISTGDDLATMLILLLLVFCDQQDPAYHPAYHPACSAVNGGRGEPTELDKTAAKTDSLKREIVSLCNERFGIKQVRKQINLLKKRNFVHFSKSMEMPVANEDWWLCDSSIVEYFPFIDDALLVLCGKRPIISHYRLLLRDRDAEISALHQAIIQKDATLTALFRRVDELEKEQEDSLLSIGELEEKLKKASTKTGIYSI